MYAPVPATAEIRARRERLGMVPPRKPIPLHLVRAVPPPPPPKPVEPPFMARLRKLFPVAIKEVIEKPRLEAIRSIKAEVAHKYGLTVADITGPSRKAKPVAARQELCYRLRHETPMNWHAIGRAVGGRDHATVIYSVNKHAMRLKAGAA